MGYKLNWKDAERKVLPDGTECELTVKKNEFIAKSITSGQPMVNVQFTVGDNTAGSEYEGLSVFRRFSLQPNALWAYKEMLVKFGAPESMFEDEEIDIEKIMDDSVGLRGRALVSVREYEDKKTGETRQSNDIKSFLSAQTFDVFEPTGKKK